MSLVKNNTVLQSRHKLVDLEPFNVMVKEAMNTRRGKYDVDLEPFDVMVNDVKGGMTSPPPTRNWKHDVPDVVGYVLADFLMSPKLYNVTKAVLSEAEQLTSGDDYYPDDLYHFSSKFQNCMTAQDMWLKSAKSDDVSQQMEDWAFDYANETCTTLCKFAKEVGVKSTMRVMKLLVGLMPYYPSDSKVFNDTDEFLLFSGNEGVLEWHKATCTLMVHCVVLSETAKLSPDSVFNSTEHKDVNVLLAKGSDLNRRLTRKLYRGLRL